MKDAEVDLLLDLARLLKKYGAEQFEALAGSIGSPEVSAKLAALLTGASEAARSARQREVPRAKAPPKARGAPIAVLLEAVKASEPEKYLLLSRLYQDLKDARMLPTMRDIRTFLSDRGLPGISATSRNKAVSGLMRLLLPLPLEELKNLSMRLVKYERHDRGLEGWSNLILGKDRRG